MSDNFTVAESALAAPVQQLLEGDLSYYPQLFSAPQAHNLYHRLLNEICWKQESVVIYGQRHLLPRLQSWIGDPQQTYQYSGQVFHPSACPPTVRMLLNTMNQLLPYEFNSVLANYYRDGNDSMGWHSDNEKELGASPVIASLSFGISRDFAVRKAGDSKQHLVLPLNAGSLLIMKAGMQSRWQHALPKRKRITAGRINLTFRKMVG